MSREKVKDSANWFANKLKIRNRDKSKIVYHKLPEIGGMYLYRYDPKWKEILPFWDKQPLMVTVKYYNDGFLGLNLHYLPPSGRKKLLDALSKYTQGEDEKRRFQISYSILQSSIKHPLFMPCVKRYLFNHVRSKFEFIDPSEWDKAVSMPTQRFAGASSRSVWRRVARR